ncbi:hypothetical protein MNBD_GAMMA08-225, partial [hydrothermal vent metagenome]
MVKQIRFHDFVIDALIYCLYMWFTLPIIMDNYSHLGAALPYMPVFFLG